MACREPIRRSEAVTQLGTHFPIPVGINDDNNFDFLMDHGLLADGGQHLPENIFVPSLIAMESG
jgi:hypothetical protein